MSLIIWLKNLKFNIQNKLCKNEKSPEFHTGDFLLFSTYILNSIHNILYQIDFSF